MEPELLDLLQFLVEYLILHPIAFDLLSEFLYQLVRILPLSKLLSWIRNKSHKLADNIQDRGSFVREDLSNIHEEIASAVINHRCNRSGSQMPAATAADQENYTVRNLPNLNQVVDPTVLTHCSSPNEVQVALHSILRSPHISYTADLSAEGNECENDSTVPNPVIAQSRITSNFPVTNFTPGYSGRAKTESSQLRSFNSDSDSTLAGQLRFPARLSTSGRKLRAQNTLPFSSFSPVSTVQGGISIIETDSRRPLAGEISTLPFNSFCPETVLETDTVNLVEYDHSKPNEAKDFKLERRVEQERRKLRNCQMHKPKIRQLDTNSVRQTQSTDMMDLSQTPPADRVANETAMSDSAQFGCFSIKHESLAPSIAGSSRLEGGAVDLRLRSGQNSSAGDKLENSIPIDWDSRDTLANSSASPPAAGLVMTAAMPSFEQQNYKEAVPGTSGDLRPEEDAVYFKLGIEYVLSDDGRLEEKMQMEQTTSPVSASSSTESIPSDGFSSSVMMSGSTTTASHPEVEDAARYSVGDWGLEEALLFIKLRSGQVCSAGARLMNGISIKQITSTAFANFSRRKVRRTRSLGGSPSSKRKCCLQDWYGDKYRRRCEEHIPEVVQRYGRPANFVSSHFSSTMSAIQDPTSRQPALSSIRPVPTLRSSPSNVRNEVSNSTHSSPPSTHSVSTSRKAS